eukprot:785343-Pelagomonas_calceolata.AAC.3
MLLRRRAAKKKLLSQGAAGSRITSHMQLLVGSLQLLAQNKKSHQLVQFLASSDNTKLFVPSGTIFVSMWRLGYKIARGMRSSDSGTGQEKTCTWLHPATGHEARVSAGHWQSCACRGEVCIKSTQRARQFETSGRVQRQICGSALRCRDCG